MPRTNSREERETLALKVLSHIPYSPCGATLALLATAVFGDDTEAHRAEVIRGLRAIPTLLNIYVTSASLKETGDGSGRTPHFWIRSKSDRRRASRLVEKYLNTEDDPKDTEVLMQQDAA